MKNKKKISRTIFALLAACKWFLSLGEFLSLGDLLMEDFVSMLECKCLPSK